METLTAKKCPYIIKLYGHCGDKNQLTSRFIALEFLGDGNVEDILESYKKDNHKQVPEQLVRHITADVTEALMACRDSNEHIYHRDIKPENIMVVKDGDDYERFVLIDFGLAKEIDLDESIKHTLGEQGTRAYIDPAMSFKD